MRDIVQTGFFDAESTIGDNDEIIVSPEWMALSDDEFKQSATAWHRELDQQETVIDALKNKIILEKGELYIAAKAKFGHGKYLGWLEEIKVSPDTAQCYSKLAKDHGYELANAERVRHLSLRQWIRISRSPESHQIVAKIEDGKIEPTSTAINDEITAAKKRAEEAELAKIQAEEAEKQAREKAQLAQQQLFTAQSEAQTQIAEYTSQINELKQEMAELVKPEVQIKEVQVIPQTVKDQLQRLQDKAKTLTEQRDNLAAMNKKLSADLDVVEAKREQEARDARIRLDFQKLTKATYDTLIKFATQIPMHVDLPVLEPDDWARVEELASTMSQISERLFGLHKSMTNQFVDASTGSIVEG